MSWSSYVFYVVFIQKSFILSKAKHLFEYISLCKNLTSFKDKGGGGGGKLGKSID
jgi:hypothetical protein